MIIHSKIFRTEDCPDLAYLLKIPNIKLAYRDHQDGGCIFESEPLFELFQALNIPGDYHVALDVRIIDGDENLELLRSAAGLESFREVAPPEYRLTLNSSCLPKTAEAFRGCYGDFLLFADPEPIHFPKAPFWDNWWQNQPGAAVFVGPLHYEGDFWATIFPCTQDGLLTSEHASKEEYLELRERFCQH